MLVLLAFLRLEDSHFFWTSSTKAGHYRWRNQYGGMKSEEAKQLKELELENNRLKKLLAEAELDKAMLKEIASGNCRASSMLAFARGPFPQA